MNLTEWKIKWNKINDDSSLMVYGSNYDSDVYCA
jgi:hypothetical protein